jgi:hypothetical protein
MDTEHWITYEVPVELDPTPFAHCCYYLAKYMERLGMCENKSSLHDAIYYTPQYFYNRFRYKKDIKLTLS